MNTQASVSCWIALAMLIHLGCSAGFRRGDLGEIEKWPLAAASQPAITVEITGLKAGSWRAAEILRAFREAGAFSAVNVGQGDDLHATVTVDKKRTRVRPIGPYLTFQMLTLWLIPQKYDREEFALTMVFRKGAKTHAPITKSEIVEQWDHLFLIFLAPFQGPIYVLKRAYYDVARASLAEARAAGVF